MFANKIVMFSEYLNINDKKNTLHDCELSQEKVSKSKENIRNSNASCQRLKQMVEAVLDSCLKSDFENKSSVELVTHTINESMGWRTIDFKERMPMDKIDSIIVKTFSIEDDVLQILRLNEPERDYWLIVKDIYSDNSIKYNEIYYDILEENENDYFSLKVLNKSDLEGLSYMCPTSIYRKDDILAD